ncbi:hypothetical protein FRB94_011476 [Tulasnella sp. JGI-2019a]|nr:hypothetical protein FRB94_011476 [Tulasnella sp. JGI-2019a]KAG9034598.1 hypothetical protein FRB95_013051 [Tulasnella sp. JGI-2019a]
MANANKPSITQQEGDYRFETYKPAGKLFGKEALMTGGDSGIGRSVAAMYAMEGTDVSASQNVGIVYLPEEREDAQDTESLIIKYGQKALLIPQGIRDEEGCKRIIGTFVDAFGQIDILVNNASVMFDRTIRTNIYGTFFITRAAILHIPKGGSIITTASQVAYAGPPSLVDYSMTKGAQVAMTRCLSNQLLSEGIRDLCGPLSNPPRWIRIRFSNGTQVPLRWEESVVPSFWDNRFTSMAVRLSLDEESCWPESA